MYTNRSYKEKLNTRHDVPKVDMNSAIEILQVKESIENGVVSKKLEVVSRRFESDRTLTVNDFKMENLQAIGADKGLKEYTPKPNLNYLENAIVNIENNIDSIEETNEKDN